MKMSSFRQSCTTCARFTVILFNLLLAVVALAVFGFALWIWLDSQFERALRTNILNTTPSPQDLSQTKQDMRTAITISFWVIIGVSVLTAVVCLVGIIGSIAQKRAINLVFVSFLIILIILQIGLGVFIIAYRPNIRGVTNRYCSLAFQYNTADAAALADRYQCCGDGTQNQYNQQCFQLGSFFARDCPTVVWQRLDFTLLIAGLIMLGVLAVEILTVIFGVTTIVNHRYGTLVN